MAPQKVFTKALKAFIKPFEPLINFLIFLLIQLSEMQGGWKG